MGNAYVYIDGFNFYYGVVKNTAYKWLWRTSLLLSDRLQLEDLPGDTDELQPHVSAVEQRIVQVTVDRRRLSRTARQAAPSIPHEIHKLGSLALPVVLQQNVSQRLVRRVLSLYVHR